METNLVDIKNGIVYEKYSVNIFVMIPCMNPRTGRGLLRYIQSLHQYQRNLEESTTKSSKHIPNRYRDSSKNSGTHI